MLKTNFVGLKVDREYATEVRDNVKKHGKNSTMRYRRMVLLTTDKNYKVVFVDGCPDAILDLATSDEHIVDILYVN